MTAERWHRIEDLFHEARERAPEERAAFLARECASDAGLRQEIESLLAQEEGRLLREGIVPTAATLVASHPRGGHEGRHIGPYLLGPLLGMGGMGDVYRAHDAKLHRDVAVKILPDALARDRERLARFEREARVLGALNHPNIASIYGVEESEGRRGLVLELVEGVTLKEKLGAGRLVLEEALAIARQIAAALEAAHEKGVVHRDLKPANIQIGAHGLVKVLDFGLAKFEAPDRSGPAGVTTLATNDGVVLGTVAYMSPEQARGLAVDKRTDIWAFGCVLFEMLTGARSFPGDTAADVLGGITSREPDWQLLPLSTPVRVREVLRRCLTKDPERRLHDIADARIEIEDALSADRAAGPPDRRAAASRRSWTVAAWMLGVAAATTVAVAAWFGTTARTPERRRPVRLAIPLPADVSLFAVGRGSSVAVSPDGQRIVFVGIAGDRRQLYMRSLDGSESTPIAGTENAASPFFSPDGMWIGFMDQLPGGNVRKVPVQGGTPVTVVEHLRDGSTSFAVQGATWAPDDTIVFSAINPLVSGLWRVAANGGKPVRVAAPRPGELWPNWPQVLPGGNAMIYTNWSNTSFDGGSIAVKAFSGGEARILAERASYGRVVSPDGRRAWLVFARPEGLHAAPFDLERLQVTGRAMPVLDGVLVNLSGGAHFSVSDDGLLAYIPGGLDEARKTLVWVARDGTATEIGTIPGVGFQYQISPDGRRLARPNAVGPTRDLWIDDLAGRGPSIRLTIGGVHNMPIWTPDSKRVIYSSGAPNANLFWRSADGTGDEERLTTSPNLQVAGSVSPDGATLVYSEVTAATRMDIWFLPLQPPRQPRLFLGTPFAEVNPRISPDGRWVAYSSDNSGQFEIYLSPFPHGGRRIPVSNGGGFAPLWSRDGRELYYRSTTPEAGGDMMVVSIDAGAADPTVGTPRILFPSPYQGGGDVAPDGRFLLLKRTPFESPSRVIQLVLNWFDDLAARVPLQ